MFKIFNLFNFMSDFLIRFCLGIIFFNFGYGKLDNLIANEAQGLISMIESIYFFGLAPIFFSWCLALSETFLILGLIYGLFTFLPFSVLISRSSGVIALLISLVIMYQHIFVWGDNIFTYGPFEFLNTDEQGKPVYGQFLFIPLSMYVIFNNRQNINLNIDNK